MERPEDIEEVQVEQVELGQEGGPQSAPLHDLDLDTLRPVDYLNGKYLANRNYEVLAYQLQ